LNNYAESSLIQGTGMWWIIFTCSVVEVHNRLRLNQISTKKPPAVRSAYQF